ncbi:MAG TPA: restriction endonuclease [Noviherbaspirillum sp.]|nr:restriction endonuclease [Noviherbaspirillum sp.]
MARRRKDAGLVDVFMSLPWWASAIAACISFAALRWVIPGSLAENRLLQGVALGLHSIAWLPFALFAIIAVVVFVRDRYANPSRQPNESTKRRKIAPVSVSDQLSSKPESVRMDATVSKSILPSPEQGFNAWSLDALRALEWKRFELLCARYYEAVGFKTQTIRCGADGGIDVKLFKTDPSHPIAVVQCKAWNTSAVGVKEIRELLGVMAHEKVGRGIFITTGTYTRDALAFGANNPIQLLDGTAFLEKIRALPEESTRSLLRFAFEGDFRTPTCPSCGIKMVEREGKRGAFWGCMHYPKCKSVFSFKQA